MPKTIAKIIVKVSMSVPSAQVITDYNIKSFWLEWIEPIISYNLRKNHV